MRIVPLMLVKQAHRFDGSGFAGGEQLAQVFEREAGINDVLHDDHMPSGDARVKILDDAHHAGGLRARAIA